MYSNYDIKVLGIISGISLILGFTSGYFTKKYLNPKNKSKSKKPIKNSKTPPSTPSHSDNDIIEDFKEDIVSIEEL